MVSGIVGNIAILLAIALTYKTLRPGEGREPKTFGKIGVGFLLGLIGTLLIFQGASSLPILFHVPSILSSSRPFLRSGSDCGGLDLSLSLLFIKEGQGLGQGGGTLMALVGLLWKSSEGASEGPSPLPSFTLPV